MILFYLAGWRAIIIYMDMLYFLLKIHYYHYWKYIIIDRFKGMCNLFSNERLYFPKSS